MNRLRTLTVVVVVWLIVGGAATAQTQRAMTLVDLLEVPRLSDPQLSPEGGQVLYVLAEADWDANRTISHIWRVNRDGGGSVQLTNGEKGETSPRWSPDGETVVFLATRGDADATQIYVLPNLGGEARQLTDHPTAVSSITWSPDGRTIYFLASDEKTAEQQARDTAKDDVYAFEEAFQQRHLWTVAVSNGTTERVPRVTTRFSASTCHATDDGSRYSVGRTRCSSIGTRARSG